MADKTYTASEAAWLVVLTPLVVALILVLSFPLTMWLAYVTKKLWNWFPAVYFHLQPISFWMMVGISCTVSMFRVATIYKDHEVDWKKDLISRVLGPAILLGIGYLVHLKLH